MTRARSFSVHLLLLSLCSWAIYVHMTYRVPGGYALAMLPIVNLAAASLTFVAMVLHLMGRIPVDEPFRTMFRWVEQCATAFIAAFCLFNALVYFNARWDRTALRTVASEIIEIGGREVDLGYSIHYFWAEIRSWRSPRTTERLLLRLSEREKLWTGRPISVTLHSGYFNIPWISSIKPNEEREWNEIISNMPAASGPRRDLVYLYLEQNRWKDVTRLAADQMRLYPNDLVFIRYVTGVLLNAHRFSEIITLLEPIAKRKSDYQIFSKLGFALAMRGRKPEGLKYLAAAIAKEPRNYWAYSALGYAHVYTGTPQEAVPYFEKVLQIRPNSPEVQEMLRQLRAR